LSGNYIHWAVALEGESFELEDAAELFANTARISVCKINVAADRNPRVLISDDFKHLDNSADVHEAKGPDRSDKWFIIHP
jgi:hypothetical protein